MKAIILAAGKGKRMQTDLQKVMHPILGKPIVQYVAEAVQKAGLDDITVVIGSEGVEEIKDGLSSCKGLFFAVQESPLGTGDAVKAGASRIKNDDDVLVLFGDMPLVTPDFIKQMIIYKKDNPCDVLVAGADHDITKAGIFIFNGEALFEGLKSSFLADVPKILREMGKSVSVFNAYEDMSVFTSINTQIQLAEAVAFMRKRINECHMLNGVRMIDPSSVFITDSVKISSGVVIYPNVILEGECVIGKGAVIGMNSHLLDTIVEDDVFINQSTTINAVIGKGTTVGPFAYLRPDAKIGKHCRIGNFVEIKNANIGDNTNMAHLAYIGDADVGDEVNFSCGAITANYDGKYKHRTKIGNKAFIGSNANLIAPIEIGENSVVAAGSTLTKDLPPCALGIARERQCVKSNWKKA